MVGQIVIFCSPYRKFDLLMLKILLVLIITLYHTMLFSQYFIGTITYAFENEWVSDELKATEIKVPGITPLEQANGFVKIYQIDNASLIEKAYNNEGIIFTIAIQGTNDTYRLYKKGEERHPYEEDPKFKIEEADRKEKTNEKKFILGMECQKYVYWFTSQQTQIELWLADGFTFDKKKQTRQFFGDIFQKEGLVMEYRLLAKSATNVWRIKEIAIHAHEIPLEEQMKTLEMDWK